MNEPNRTVGAKSVSEKEFDELLKNIEKARAEFRKEALGHFEAADGWIIIDKYFGHSRVFEQNPHHPDARPFKYLDK
jgi:hypothetical protein